MAGFAAVVEVEHGADGIHAQCIDVQVLKPEQGVGHQEVAYFAASEVEHIGAPFRVFAAQRVRVLVQRGAVEAAEREGILREVGGHPVHDHADAGLMELVDQVTEVVGGTETGVDRIVAGDLIAPGAGERVLGQWHELHVGEAFLLDVVHELLGQVAVGQSLPPAAGVHLIDGDRAIMRVGGAAVLHPGVIVPLVGGFGDDGGGVRRNFVLTLHRVSLHLPRVIGVQDLELVGLARADSGDEDLPHAGGAELAHGMTAAIPSVEVTDYAHGMGVRGPHGECGAYHLFAGRAVCAAHRIVIAQHMRAKRLPELLVTALAEQIGVHVADCGHIAIWVVLNEHCAAFPLGPDTVVGNRGLLLSAGSRHGNHEHAVVFVGHRVFAILGEDGHGLGKRTQHTDCGGVGMLADAEMPAENSVGIVEFSIARRIEVALGDRHGDGIFLDLRFFSHDPKSTCVGVVNATLARRKWRILALFVVFPWL